MYIGNCVKIHFISLKMKLPVNDVTDKGKLDTERVINQNYHRMMAVSHI